eukprot:TRINITY_DN22042_c0_g1_i1.p2 TRINITY_DN22042_c0_g1~~TRINITY_DN22042_c0_g1_i1.p2  ORF type:complete len:137 (-),score=34.77 TRINITY_DN22042_c0_g1_i1:37-447(-)
MCIRDRADFVTDFIFVYVNFSIYSVDERDIKIKVNYCITGEKCREFDQKSKIEASLKKLELLLETGQTGQQQKLEQIYKGFAHSGMFLSALSLYMEIEPLLEKFFSQDQHKEFKIAITGHSLGGCLLYTSPSPRDS